MNDGDIRLFCDSEMNAFRLNIAAELVLGTRYTKKETSRTVEKIKGKYKTYKDLRKRAIEECLAVLEAEPKNCLAHYFAGHAYASYAAASCYASQMDLRNKAAVHYEHALDQIKDGHEHKALIFLPADKRHDESLSLDKKVELGLAELYSETGLVYMETGRWPEAAVCYKKVTECDPLRTGGWAWLAKSLFKTEGVDRAIEVLDYALGLDEQHENFEPVLGSYLRKYNAIVAQRDEFMQVEKNKDSYQENLHQCAALFLKVFIP